MSRKRLYWVVGLVLFIGIAWNYPVTYRIGVNSVVYTKNIPLYAKICGYLYRDWMYKDIVNTILADRKEDDEKKVLDILKWTNENVMLMIPKGLRVVDDHPLNIIIRQYGANDQVEDVFTLLCAYAGFKAGMEKCSNSDRTKRIVLSFVNVNGRWLIFNASKGKYFLNREGAIGSVADYLKGGLVLSGDDNAYYTDYMGDLKNMDFSFTRADEQMPLRRIPIEVKKKFTEHETVR